MTVPKRPSANLAARSREEFAADVRYYLSMDPRQLPSRYLYDDLGSTLFEAICRLPWYSPRRAEMRLLETHAAAVIDARISMVVELGSGSGEKLSALIAGRTGGGSLDLHLIDVSPSAMDEAARRVSTFDRVRVCAHETTYERGLEEFAAEPRDEGRALVLFLGSNIGNFDPPGRDAFLRLVRNALKPGDLFLLGVDLVKPAGDLLLAYDDPLGVTAAFNRNLLVRINRELQGNFDLDGFAHQARWNADESRVEMHLVSRGPQRVRIEAADLELTLGGGESIWTESSYKFEPPRVVTLLEGCGFRVDAQWIDTADAFALTCAEAIPADVEPIRASPHQLRAGTSIASRAASSTSRRPA